MPLVLSPPHLQEQKKIAPGENSVVKNEEAPPEEDSNEIYFGEALEGHEKRLGYFFTWQWVKAKSIKGWEGEPKQPSEFSRGDVWILIQKGYSEVHPNKTELLYGCVVRELHKNSNIFEEREPHFHIATMTSKPHGWLGIERYLRENFGVKLHVSSIHGGYASQYSYIRCGTTKKPLSELDQDPFLSENHPYGDELAKILKDDHIYEKWSTVRLLLQP